MVLGSTGMGGAQMFVLNLLRNLDLNRFQVDFAVNFKEKNGGIGDEVQKLGCNIYYLPYFKVYNYLEVVNAWRQFLHNHRYDIVHGHSTNSAAVYLKVAKEMGCATIAHCHSAGFRGNYIERLMKVVFTRRIGEVADYWFACSGKAAEHLYGKKYREYKNYFDIPNAINAENYLYNETIAKKIRKEIGVKDDELLCGHVGTFSSPKNHMFLLTIFEDVLKLRPNAKLVCCGTGELLNSVLEKTKELGIQNRIIFPGVVKNCNEYMMAMDVFIFPSLFEGFPVSVIEAEATGLPVVMSNVITKEVDITDCIYRHSLHESSSEWAKTICGISSTDRKVYNKAVANSKYNMQTSVKMIQSLYERLVSDSSNSACVITQN